MWRGWGGVSECTSKFELSLRYPKDPDLTNNQGDGQLNTDQIKHNCGKVNLHDANVFIMLIQVNYLSIRGLGCIWFLGGIPQLILRVEMIAAIRMQSDLVTCCRYLIFKLVNHCLK